MRLFGRRPRIQIALGADRLVAVLPRGRRLETTEVADLGRAFAEMRRTTTLRRAVVTVALVPPLVELRRLQLPPLRDEERRRVLTRDAARYFVGAREPQVMGTEVLPAAGAPVLAAAAPAQLIDALEAAVQAAGWTLAGVIPAHAAWAASVRARGARPEQHVVVRLPQATEVLRLETGRLVERRRFPPGTDPDPPDGAVVLAPPQTDPLVVAAQYARGTTTCELCSERTYATRQGVARRVAAVMVAAAAACLVLAAGVDFWGLGRQLAAVHARRAGLTRKVAVAMRARDSLEAIVGSVGRLRTLRVTSQQWSAFLTDLSDYLPRDAHVVSLRGAADSAVIEGIARQAAGVFQAVQQIPRVGGVRAAAPIRQEVAADGSVREQFALGTVLRAPAVPQAARRGP
jgi:hypothetical protein